MENGKPKSKIEIETVESFYTIARHETGNWCADTLARYRVQAVFGLYLTRAGEMTHLCSLTPAARCDFLENALIFEDDATDDQRETALCDLSYDDGGESVSYIERLDVLTMDSRFVAGPIEIDPLEDAPDLDPDSDDYRDAIWMAARDSWFPNPDQPAITEDSAFDAWQDELAAARRAENRPVCDYARRDVLPLFGAAWGKAQETIGKVQGWGGDLDGMRRESA